MNVCVMEVFISVAPAIHFAFLLFCKTFWIWCMKSSLLQIRSLKPYNAYSTKVRGKKRSVLFMLCQKFANVIVSCLICCCDLNNPPDYLLQICILWPLKSCLCNGCPCLPLGWESGVVAEALYQFLLKIRSMPLIWFGTYWLLITGGKLSLIELCSQVILMAVQ